MSSESAEVSIPRREQTSLNPDDYTWAISPLRGIEELKKRGEKEGLNIPDLVRGYVLDTILGDDGGLFLDAMIATKSDEPFDPKKAHVAQEKLMIRLDWETNIEELPENIRVKLQEVKEKVTELDWSKESDYKKAEKVWNAARDWVETQSRQDPKLIKARKYYFEKAFLA